MDLDKLETKIAEEWEDCEEPETLYYITAWGDIIEYAEREEDRFSEKQKREIGNYFNTREEAERAAEKLKAWKRLKDKGFKFTDYDVADPVGDGEFCGQTYFRGGNYNRSEIMSDLDLLFRGKEC